MKANVNIEGKQQTAKKSKTYSFAKFYKDQKNMILGSISLILFFAIWELVSANLWIDPLFISSPTAIWTEFLHMLIEPSFWKDIRISGYEFAIGFGISVAIGIPLGVITGWNSTMYALTNPFISALYVTPRVALMPVIVIALGIGVGSKVAIVVLMAIFPIIINAQKAMQTLDTHLIKAARSFAANDWQIFKTVALPASVPFLLTGLRLGVGLGLIGVVVGELYAATAGVGFMLTTAGANLQTDRMFVGVIFLAIVGVTLTSMIGIIERHYSSWRPDRE